MNFGLVNVNWKLIQFLVIGNFWKLEKIEFNWKLGNIQFSKIENRKQLIWPLVTRTVFISTPRVEFVFWFKNKTNFHFSFSNFITTIWKWNNFLEFIFWTQIKKCIRQFRFLFFWNWFWIKIEKMKNVLKFVFSFQVKKGITKFGIFIHAVNLYFIHSIFNEIFWLEIDFYPNFQSSLISNSLIRFWILKNKSIMEIQFLKWKFKIQFSIFNSWKWKYFSSNPIFKAHTRSQV